MKVTNPNVPGNYAIFSEDRTKRYWLQRDLYAGRIRPASASRGLISFVMLNPSTADATKDDPTIRRCTDYAKRWGFSTLVVANLFAYRATQPRDLENYAKESYNEGERSAWFDVYRDSSVVVYAWGAPKWVWLSRAMQPRIERLRAYGSEQEAATTCIIGHPTVNGHPRHPLYLPKSAELRALDVW